MKKVSKLVTLVIIGAWLSGCASMSDEDLAFHLTNSIDAYQTSRINDYDCIVEAAPFSRAILGANPSESETLVYFAAQSVLYQYLSDRYEGRKWWPVVQAFIRVDRTQVVRHTQQTFEIGCGG